jgi:hypothetical protein
LQRHWIVTHHLRKYLACRLRIEFVRGHAKLERRVSPPGGLPDKLRGFAGDRYHLREVTIAMKDHVTSCDQRGTGSLGQSTGKCIHRNVVAHQQALESNKSANHLPYYCDRSGGGRDWVYIAKHNMRCHPERQVRQSAECREIDGLEGGAVCVDDRQLVMAIDSSAAMTGQVL